MPIYGPWAHTKPGYKQVGQWGWDNDRLHSKIDKTPDANGCLNWNGAMSPTGALMGAWKSTGSGMKQQMTQVRRLIMLDATGEDISDYQVKLTCGNQRCCNHKEHFVLKPNNRIAVSKQPAKPKRAYTKRTAKWWDA